MAETKTTHADPLPKSRQTTCRDKLDYPNSLRRLPTVINKFYTVSTTTISAPRFGNHELERTKELTRTTLAQVRYDKCDGPMKVEFATFQIARKYLIKIKIKYKQQKRSNTLRGETNPSSTFVNTKKTQQTKQRLQDMQLHVHRSDPADQKVSSF